MTYDELAALIPTALALHKLTNDPLALDAIRVVQEALVDTHTLKDHQLSPMQLTAIGYLQKMETARMTLGIDV